jgi:hypothetical protein
MQTNSIRLVAGAGLLSVALTGCTSGSGSATGAPATAAARSSAAPASTAVRDDGIPGTALLQPADVRGAQAEPMEEGESAHVRPLRPCGDDRYPSDGSRTDAVAMRYVVPGPEQGSTPSVVTEFVGRHEAGGAAAQFGDIRAALDRCPGGLGEGQRQWTIVESAADSMLVRIDQRFSYADEEPATVSHYAALATVKDAVVVVADLGWENMGGDEKLVRDLIGKAEQRAATIG